MKLCVSGDGMANNYLGFGAHGSAGSILIEALPLHKGHHMAVLLQYVSPQSSLDGWYYVKPGWFQPLLWPVLLLCC
jgi:hypothetical protein